MGSLKAAAEGEEDSFQAAAAAEGYMPVAAEVEGSRAAAEQGCQLAAEKNHMKWNILQSILCDQTGSMSTCGGYW